MFKKLIICLTLIALTIVSGCGRSEERAPTEGALVPNFELKTLDGNRIEIPQDLKKINILIFWGSESMPSKRELKMIDDLTKTNSEVQVITINIDPQDQDPLGIMRKLGVKLPVAVDEDRYLAQLYEIDIMPTTFVIDEKGMIKKRIVGGSKEEDILEYLK